MKKILFSLFALMAVMTVQAQSITSTWRSIQPVVSTAADDSFTAASYTYTFNGDGTYTEVVEQTIATEPARTMALEVATILEVKGTYTLNGDKLTLTPNKNSFKSDVISISKNGRVINDSKIKSNAKKQVNDGEVKAQMLSNQTATVKVGKALLEMNGANGKINFARLAKIKN
ncbi:MAG: hypothetical protein IKW85_08760 [Muribaculaceae bacterium]|nr:hypothetical protein [Muribaculaceae bacterium]